jgi:hypothetical protein
MNPISKQILLLVLTMAVASAVAAAQPVSVSPENQVFQFMRTGSFDFGGGTPGRASGAAIQTAEIVECSLQLRNTK